MRLSSRPALGCKTSFAADPKLVESVCNYYCGLTLMERSCECNGMLRLLVPPFRLGEWYNNLSSAAFEHSHGDLSRICEGIN